MLTVLADIGSVAGTAKDGTAGEVDLSVAYVDATACAYLDGVGRDGRLRLNFVADLVLRSQAFDLDARWPVDVYTEVAQTGELRGITMELANNVYQEDTGSFGGPVDGDHNQERLTVSLSVAIEDDEPQVNGAITLTGVQVPVDADGNPTAPGGPTTVLRSIKLGR